MKLIVRFLGLILMSNTTAILAMDGSGQPEVQQEILVPHSLLEGQRIQLFYETTMIWNCYIENCIQLHNLQTAAHSCQTQLDFLQSQVVSEESSLRNSSYFLEQTIDHNLARSRSVLDHIRREIDIIRKNIEYYAREYKQRVYEYIQIPANIEIPDNRFSQGEGCTLFCLPASYGSLYVPQAAPENFNNVPSKISPAIERLNLLDNGVYEVKWDEDCPTDEEFYLLKQHQEYYKLGDEEFEIFMNYIYEYKQMHKVSLTFKILQKIFVKWLLQQISGQTASYIRSDDNKLKSQYLGERTKDHPTVREFQAFRRFNKTHNLNDKEFQRFIDFVYHYKEIYKVNLTRQALEKIYKEYNSDTPAYRTEQ